MSVDAMRKHVEKICREYSVQVTSHSRGGRAWRKKKVIAIRPVKSSITYAIALHELGHILGPGQNGTRLDKEAGAWIWAKEHALIWTATMEQAMIKRLKAYVEQLRRHKTAKCPDDHKAFDLLEGRFK